MQTGLISVNILKLYQTIDRHLELHPEDKARFPNFDPTAGPTLAFGASGPVEGTRHYAKYFHGRDGLGDISSRHPELDVDPKIRRGIQVTEKSGVQLSLELIQDRPARSITYIALGPLTNLAQLIRANGQAVRDRIGRVVCMGGALDVPGNMSPVAEFNFYADPYAVEEVLVPSDPNQGIPLDRFILLPLDITTVHDLPFPSYKEKIDPHFESTASPSIAAMKTPICHFTSSFFEKTREVMAFYGKDVMELHDIVAVWCAIENPPVEIEDDGGLPKMSDRWKTMLRHFEVEKIGERTRGMLVIDRRDERAAYAPELTALVCKRSSKNSKLNTIDSSQLLFLHK
ncbi:hypothetical protein SERLADRAFT_465909 [Serpula lacrymans var. lacrymans S7.9]|uniref:Inosine/uridine-preferring nucleoside hydrolase domain-containing protein n=1 Tax=Serpula lacrymans var. lacrymans (strain S7.9) TaxID=578457 RepID=F8NT90_SERL9|nr:uncharacterized protein SERLADRAFT_465909 [Serpula lacrymans var. lacrymans S7.9]EGO25563.1 hypothetical protein SERLADRAFT_465909 [Serpula lacrymans var. lacrymans S7.9]